MFLLVHILPLLLVSNIAEFDAARKMESVKAFVAWKKHHRSLCTMLMEDMLNVEPDSSDVEYDDLTSTIESALDLSHAMDHVAELHATQAHVYIIMALIELMQHGQRRLFKTLDAAGMSYPEIGVTCVPKARNCAQTSQDITFPSSSSSPLGKDLNDESIVECAASAQANVIDVDSGTKSTSRVETEVQTCKTATLRDPIQSESGSLKAMGKRSVRNSDTRVMKLRRWPIKQPLIKSLQRQQLARSSEA